MNALEWNKIVAALLLSILFYKGVEIYAESAFEVAEPETRAYVVEGLAVDEPAVVEATPDTTAQETDIMARLAVASPDQGQRVFRGCQACHDVNQGSGHKIGPNLFGVMGASVAQHADFRYSDALADHGGTWDFALMDAWLASPAEAIPGNKMSYRGVSKADDRAALIAYLNSHSDNPLALPTAPVPEATEEAVEEVVEETMEEGADEMPVPGESAEEMIVEEEAAPEAAPEEDATEEALEESLEETIDTEEEAFTEEGGDD